MRRRHLLAVTAGAAGALAGCASFEDGGTETETPQGQWELRGTVVNEDDQSRAWRVETRSENGNVASAYGTIPAGESWEFGLAGMLRDEELEVYAESDNASTTASWQPTQCRQLSADVTIAGGEPELQLQCDE